MLRAFSTAATGMTAQQMVVDTIANNLANINTPGFKKSQIDFQDLMYIKLQEPDENVPSGFEIGSGVRAAGTLKVFSPGEMDNTNRSLDIAIQGDGFLSVTGTDKTYYTRDGSLRIDAQGRLCTSSGLPIEPVITIPSDARSITINSDGEITVFSGSSNTATSVGTIALVRFANASGLTSEGRNLFSETPSSGAPISGTAGESGFGAIQQGLLEKSNVQMVTELVNLITAQRAYEINSRAIKAGDEMLTTTNRLIG
ncbi:MAG: flagellar basal-body rod protein FlgG [Planctomycetes bacterium]|jgi:flagellar basal-body rod protein FlgG|nr:flagellar basal-body rod protein FlgG [Planctomycetota bacterium]